MGRGLLGLERVGGLVEVRPRQEDTNKLWEARQRAVFELFLFVSRFCFGL